MNRTERISWEGQKDAYLHIDSIRSLEFLCTCSALFDRIIATYCSMVILTLIVSVVFFCSKGSAVLGVEEERMMAAIILSCGLRTLKFGEVP